ncbi:MAG: hypothetical protein JXR73_08490 [Candidatus Omnitrophica bacterium]|nr:hypothetical protein [Candidatus Omnitrophota bacterium]
MGKRMQIDTTILVGVISVVLPFNAFPIDLGVYRDADALLYSGEVSWEMVYEAFQPAPFLSIDKKPTGLSDQEFEEWLEKQKTHRRQTFQVYAVFQGDYLRFECLSDPGDALPIPCDRVVAFNGVSVTFLDNGIGNMFREPLSSSFFENHFSRFYIAPRSCGYNAPKIIQLARKVKDAYEKTPVEFSQMEDAGGVLSVYGVYPDSGGRKLVELTPDEQYPQAFRSIKYINPEFNDRILIECSDFRMYADGTVFPDKAVVIHMLGGELDDLQNAKWVDRLTLTVKSARFNGVLYDDELFNPGCPPGFHDLMDARAMIKKKLVN